MKLIITVVTISLATLASGKDEIVYPGKFKIAMNEKSFLYQDAFLRQAIPVEDCNSKILASAFNLFDLPKKVPAWKQLNQNPQKIAFLRNGKKVEVAEGSKIHANLDSLNSSIQGFISRARIACNK